MKFLKKHFTKFLMSFTLAFICLFVAFGCNTYAYTIDSNGNLVGDNLFDINNYGSRYDYPNDKFYYLDIEHSGSYTISAINTPIRFEIYGITNNGGVDYQLTVIGTQGNFDNPVFTFNIPIAFNFSTYDVVAFISTSSGVFNTDLTDYFVMLNDGTTAQNWEPYGTWYSQQNYSQLQTNYNDLQGQYINLKNRYEYGFFANLISLNIIGQNSGVQVFDDSFTLQDLINTNYFSNGTFLLDNFILSYNSNTYDNASIKFNFSPNLIPSNVDLIFVGSYAFNFHFVVGFSDNSTYGFTITNENNIISHNDLNNYSVAFGNVSITNFKFSYNRNDYIPNINFSTDYSFAYNTGFSDGQNASYSTIQQLENNINDLNSQVANMSNTINTLQIAYNDLNTSYENMLNGNNFANLFFTIAETPFASFKQIWNVDFLGVNLAGFVTGILFLGLVIWVIKKIF